MCMCVCVRMYVWGGQHRLRWPTLRPALFFPSTPLLPDDVHVTAQASEEVIFLARGLQTAATEGLDEGQEGGTEEDGSRLATSLFRNVPK